MDCRVGCGACCIAISISSPLPDMPEGKPPGVRCSHLTPERKCSIHMDPAYPKVCAALRPDLQICGNSFEEAMSLLEEMEIQTAPPQKQKVHLQAYNPEWPVFFSLEKELLGNIFPETFITIHHIGSTAVPGLKAKPVIDILAEVQSVDKLDALEIRFKEWGYACKGEFGIKGRRFYTRKNRDFRIHLHVYEDNDRNVHRHLAFRDYLLIHPGEAESYCKVKESAASKFPDDPTAYHKEKSPFIRKLELQALNYYQSIKEESIV